MNWQELSGKLEEKFQCDIDLNRVLFIVGIMEMEYPFKEYSREEKLNLISLGGCRLYQELGWMEKRGEDREGWPLFSQTNYMVELQEEQKIEALKRGAIAYFERLF